MQRLKLFVAATLSALLALSGSTFAAESQGEFRSGSLSAAFRFAPGLEAAFPPVACRPSLEGSELVSITSPLGERTLHFASSCENGAFTLVALLPPGVPLFRAALEKGGATGERLLPVKMPPLEHFLGDFLLAKLPAKAWAGRLPPRWRLEDEGRTRVLRSPEGESVIVITYAEGPGAPEGVLSLENRRYGYRVCVKGLK